MCKQGGRPIKGKGVNWEKEKEGCKLKEGVSYGITHSHVKNDQNTFKIPNTVLTSWCFCYDFVTLILLNLV